ncbi:hypothetical protein M8C21_022961, partial [Ambrosia artemisiifolia]
MKKNDGMLSRAARNAYSWWWASHIRTKQSKWLDQNMQDMEEKVEYILKIMTEDGDSFRVRAEQYYRKRPELVNFVEDTFRGYRALAERYDHMSRDLQSANRTIAMVFPERVRMSIDDDEYDDLSSNVDEYENTVTTSSHVPAPLPLPPKQNYHPKMESVVQAMLKKKSKMPTMMMSKRGLLKIGVNEKASRVSNSSGLSKDEAVDEIDKLQKEILEFQTEKEFVRSSYESALSKYWEIENKINEMHTKISNLQHEFAVGEVMDDQDAQTLMSSSLLNMCKDTLDKLKCKQKRFKTEAAVEHHRVDAIRKMYEAIIEWNIKDKNVEKSEDNDQEEFDKKESENIEDKKVMTISEVAEKIEQLVDKVISLETDLASQTALIMRLRFEIDELQEKFQSLEQENSNHADVSNNKNIKIKKLHEELERVQKLDKQIKAQNMQLETSFDEASVTFENLSKDILNAKPDDVTHEDDMIFQEEKKKTEKNAKLEEKEEENLRKYSIEKLDEDENVAFKGSLQVVRKDQDDDYNGEEDEPNWNLIFSHGIEDREKMLIEEYSSTLKSFREVKQKLNETEKRNRARSFKCAVEMKMLRNANDSKDVEIRSLYEKLKLLETNIQNHDLGETTDIELMKASNAIDEETHRIEEHIDAEARELVDGGSQTSKEINETTDFGLMKGPNSVDDVTDHELQEIIDTTKQRSITEGANEGHKIPEIEEEIRTEIEDLRKENIELWLRFSTAYHQINRFQESFHDLIQEIKQLKEKKHEHGSSYKHRLHPHHQSSIALDIRPLYQHMRDMQTEVILWLEKSGILQDDLQHRLTSLSDIQNELSDLTKE